MKTVLLERYDRHLAALLNVNVLYTCSLGIHLDCENFNLESLLASNAHSCMHTQDFCLNEVVMDA